MCCKLFVNDVFVFGLVKLMLTIIVYTLCVFVCVCGDKFAALTANRREKLKSGNKSGCTENYTLSTQTIVCHSPFQVFHK